MNLAMSTLYCTDICKIAYPAPFACTFTVPHASGIYDRQEKTQKLAKKRNEEINFSAKTNYLYGLQPRKVIVIDKQRFSLSWKSGGFHGDGQRADVSNSRSDRVVH